MTQPSAEVLRPAQLVARRRAVRRARAVRIRRKIIAIGTMLALTYGGWALVHSSLFALDGVEVAGLDRVDRATLLETAGIRIGMNMLSVDTKAIEARLEAVPLIEAVTVKRLYPSKLQIHVREREAVAVLMLPGSRWLIDSRGVVIEEAGDDAGLPIIRSGDDAGIAAGSSLSDEVVLAGLAVWRETPASLKPKVTAIEASTPGAIAVRFGGVRVIVGTAMNLPEKMRILQEIFAHAEATGKTVVAVDLRAPDRPAARLR